MKICGTALVPIFVTIVFCGIIFIYFNMRLAEVKNAVEKQNKVLTAFITNVQSDIRSGGMMFGSGTTCPVTGAKCPLTGAGPSATGPSASATGPSATGPSATGATGPSAIGANHLASEEALQFVKRNEKIVVSDDEDDDDSDSESDSDDSETDDEDDDATIVPSKPVQVINLQEESSSAVSLELISDNLTLDFESLPAIQVDSSFSSFSSASVTEESLKIIDLNSSLDVDKTEISYEQMKVDDLRKFVMDLNLAGKDEVKKLKKPELLTLLKSKSA